MDRTDRKSLVYIDIEAARSTVDASGSTLGAFAGAVLGFAKGHGRVLSATAYGDIDGETSRELKRLGCESRLTNEDGDGSSPESISLVLDAMEALCRGPAVDAVTIVTDDAQVVELVRRLRKQGRYVVVLAPGALADAEPARSADRAVSIEAVLAGEVVAEPVVADSGWSGSREALRVRPPSGQTLDFATYDWARLILLMRDLEAKMPFVGMRWLKNKVIGPHNVGAVTIADKQLLLNKAVEEGLLETYRVGNRDESGDPVTACRLLRESPRVKDVLDAAPPLLPAVTIQPALETAP